MSSCEFKSNIDCIGGKCDKCGWNPDVEKERKKRLKFKKPTNLVQRLRDHKEKAAADAFRVLASQVGGKVTVDELQCIANGGTPPLGPGEFQRIDKVLRRIEGDRDG